ncbi:MAG: hypothetical protein LBU66_00605 [Treponema sp.]|jgi:hypothetical protein|nr:hypothetical protein [Treponema sp.]
MKKTSILAVIALVLAFFMTGCEDGSPKDNSSGPTKWTKGLDDLAVDAANDYGVLEYTFSATDPKAASYTLYYIEGDEADRAKIIADGQNKTVQPAAAASPGTITGLDNGKTYSIVVVAKYGKLADTYSEVQKAATILAQWTTGSVDLDLEQGEDFGELVYSFSETDPEPDSYTLYYYKGITDNRQTIINNDKKIESAAVSGAINELDDDAVYSVVVVAEKDGYSPVYSGIEQAKTRGRWIEIITDLEVSEGDNHGELNYAFSATVPAADSYTLYFSTETDDADEIIDEDNSRTITTVTGTISGLADNTTYNIVIVAKKDNYKDAISNVDGAATKDFDVGEGDEWESEPGGLIVTRGANPGTLDYSFTAADPADDVTYTLYYIEGMATGAGSIINNPSVETVDTQGALSGTISGLASITTYSFIVKAEKDGYKDGYSNAAQATTIGVFAGAPSVTLSRVEERELNYTITPANPAEGVSYTLYWRNNTSVTISNGTPIQIPAGELSGTLTGLNAGSTSALGSTSQANYSVIVVATKESYIDAASAVNTLATFVAWHTPAVSLSVKKTPNDDELVFEITRAITYAGLLGNLNYGTHTLYYAEGDSFADAQAVIDAAIAAGTTRNLGTATTTGTITGLESGTTYSFVVQATGADRKPIRTAVQTATPGGELWRKFETVTETFQNFMGEKYDTGAGHGLISTVEVRSEAEAILSSDSSGVTLTYTERTIFIPSGLFSTAWGAMRGRYPIEMWTELRERTNDDIRHWITGGPCECTRTYKDPGCDITHNNGDRDGDLIWTVENGVLGQGAANGWGIDTTKQNLIGEGATINCAVNASANSFVTTITIPLDNYFNNTDYFELDGTSGEFSAKILFNSIVSDIMKTSKLFMSDTFTMQPL